MYVILVDHGRTRLVGGEMKEMLRCIRCGACMNHCPVYRVVGGHSYGWVYPGPMGSVLTPSYIGLENALDLPHAATLCGACEVACPVMIPLPELLREAARATGRPRLASAERAGRPEALGLAALHPSIYVLGRWRAARYLRFMGGGVKRIRKLPLAGKGLDAHARISRPQGNPPRAVS